MYRGIAETHKDSIVINTIEYCNLLDMALAKKDIIDLFYKRFKFNKDITIKEYSETMMLLGINLLLLKVPFFSLIKFRLPFLLLHSYKGEEKFYLAKNISNDDDLLIFDIEYRKYIKTSLEDNKSYIILYPNSINNKKPTQKYYKTLKCQEIINSNFANSLTNKINILSQNECNDIIKFFEENNLFKESLVTRLTRENSILTTRSNVRTSYSALMQDSYTKRNYIFKKVCEEFKIKNLYSVECNRYEVDQCFLAHYDAVNDDPIKSTTIVNLNTNYSGGELFFPEIMKTFRLQRGDGIKIPILNELREPINESLYSSLSIISGVKYELCFYESF